MTYDKALEIFNAAKSYDADVSYGKLDAGVITFTEPDRRPHALRAQRGRA